MSGGRVKQARRQPGRGPRASMRLILSAAVAGLVGVTVLGVGGVAERSARLTLTAELQTRLLLEARHLALLSADALLDEYPELTLCPLVTRMQGRRDDLALAAVIDHEGLVQGHSDVRLLGAPMAGLDSLSVFASAQRLEPGEALLASDEMLVASVPVAGNDGRALGTAFVGFRRSHLDDMVTSARRQQLPLTIAMLAAGVALALLVMQHLLRPVGELKLGLERIGQGCLDAPLKVHRHTELGLLAETVNSMAARLKASQKELLEKERLAHEMALARSIQESLMPVDRTEVKDFVIVGHYHAATEVGGDFYDVFPLANGRIGIVMADVGGKGLGGCLVTSMLAVLLRSLRDLYASPSDMLVAVEKHLRGSLRPGVFVTMFYGFLDPSTGRLTYASAAHSPLLIRRADTGRTEWRRTRGIPIGAVTRPDALRLSLSDETVALAPGDLVVQFTDGLNEAAGGPQRQEFGLSRVEETVATTAREGAQGVLHRLKSSVAAWTGGAPLGDDLTLLVMERTAIDSLPVAAGRAADLATCLAPLFPQVEVEGLLRAGSHLSLPARTSELTRLRAWLQACRVLCDRTESERRLAETSLYEVCANIVEHGHKGKDGASIELWWLPAAKAADGTGRAEDILGHFIILDEGRAFDLSAWRPPNLQDPAVRRHGRGLGLKIVHSAMRRVECMPATSIGNVTVLAFASRLSGANEEALHV